MRRNIIQEQFNEWGMPYNPVGYSQPQRGSSTFGSYYQPPQWGRSTPVSRGITEEEIREIYNEVQKKKPVRHAAPAALVSAEPSTKNELDRVAKMSTSEVRKWLKLQVEEEPSDSESD